jgi:hypothetical protein
MSIYYRKIYEQHYGPIPKEENGRTYEIHHIDGNHKNIDPSNLTAVTIQEHYDIHYRQEEWSSCLLIALRMKVSVEQKAALSRLRAEQQLRDGTHPFQRPDIHRKAIENKTHNFFGGEIQRRSNKIRVDNGTHHLLAKNDTRIQNKTHHFFGGEVQSKSNENRLAAGTHPSQIKWTCEFCNRSGFGSGNYVRHHGARCKLAP